MSTITLTNTLTNGSTADADEVMENLNDILNVVNGSLDADNFTDSSLFDDWKEVDDTWTYASATTITVPSGAASLYQVGDKIKITQTTDKFFYISAVADTVLTVNGAGLYTVADAAITAKSYSRAHQPFGFPIKMLPGYGKASAYLDTASQENLTNGENTKVLLNAENFDPDSCFANYKYTAQVSGYYYVNAQVTWYGADMVADNTYLSYIYVDGFSVKARYSQASAAKYLSSPVSGLIYVAKDSYIELYARQNSGGNAVDVSYGDVLTFMDIYLVSVL